MVLSWLCSDSRELWPYPIRNDQAPSGRWACVLGQDPDLPGSASLLKRGQLLHQFFRLRLLPPISPERDPLFLALELALPGDDVLGTEPGKANAGRDLDVAFSLLFGLEQFDKLVKMSRLNLPCHTLDDHCTVPLFLLRIRRYSSAHADDGMRPCTENRAAGRGPDARWRDGGADRTGTLSDAKRRMVAAVLCWGRQCYCTTGFWRLQEGLV